MWAHRPWVGRYLSRRSGHELADYAHWCNAVEGNTTFYAVPSASTVARWAEQAPHDFRFAFKVPRTVTHEQRLRPSAHRDVAALLRAVEPLGERVGPLQIQLPPSFGPDSLGVLGEFVRALPVGRRWVVELRHRAYFDRGRAHRLVDEILAEAEVGRVVMDTRPLWAAPASTEAAVDERSNKPRLPVLADAVGASPVVRLIGADDPEVTRAGLAAWVPVVVQWLDEGREPFVFVHQPENRESPDLARQFHRLVAERRPGLAPLPEPTHTDIDRGQSSLF